MLVLDETTNLLSAGFRDSMQELAKKTKDPSLAMEDGYPILIPTTFTPFDYKNGMMVDLTTVDDKYHYTYPTTGLGSGSMVMFIGLNGSGKTALAIQMATSIVGRFRNSVVIHDDLERGTNKMRIKLLSGWSSAMIENKYILRSKSSTAKNFKQSIFTHINNKLQLVQQYPDQMMYNTGTFDVYGKPVYEIVPSVYILDSLPMLQDVDSADEKSFLNATNMDGARNAKTNAEIFKKIVPMLGKANVLLFVINHINNKIEANPFSHSQSQNNYLGQGESIVGGNTPLYLANNVIKVVTSDKVTEEKNPYGTFTGWHSKLKLIKSRSNRAGLEANLLYDQEYGYNRLLSTYEMIKGAGMVQGAGRSYYLEGLPNIKFSQKQFLSKMEDSLIMRQCFKELTEHVGSDFLSGNTKNAVVESEEDMKQRMDAFAESLKYDLLSA